MAHVGPTGLGDRVVIDVNDTVEIVCNDFGDVVEFLEIILPVVNERGKGKGGKVTNGRFVWGRIFNDFCTEI